MKIIFQKILRIITILIIKKYRPLIIAITGSVGKTSTKEGIYAAYSDYRKMQKSSGNLNTEIGAPLVFLRVKQEGRNAKEWILILLKGINLLIKRDSNYPEIVIAELGADKPGDIKYLTEFIKPDIGVVTAVGDVPVHIEFYKDAKEVAKEKEQLSMAVRKKGSVVLNIDDHYVSQMKTKGKKITFGFNKKADIHIKSFKVESLKGSSLILNYQNKDFPLFLSGCIGESFAYIAASTFAVGVALGIDTAKIPQMIEKIRPAKSRLNIIKGKSNTILLDASYNTSPSSMISALKSLKEVPAKRKIAVIGDMLELGDFSKNEHRKIGDFAGSFVDYIFVIGKWGEDIKKGAINAGIDGKKVFVFEKSEDVAQMIGDFIEEEDVILIKGSQGVRTEKVVLVLMRDPERAKELIVRQEGHWKNN